MGTGLTATYLRSVLDYDAETGVFRWKWRADLSDWDNKRIAGEIAGGSHDKNGRVRIEIMGRAYYAHRLAWLYMTGEWPEGLIDHRDTDAGNNRWENLRPATRSQNTANSKARLGSRSGLKGVSWRKREKKWVARIMKDGKSQSLGYFDKPEDAHAVYAMAAAETFGEFARAG